MTGIPFEQDHDVARANAYHVVDVAEETPTVRSFHLEPINGSLPTFIPGQSLPLIVGLPDGSRVRRNYTISGGNPGRSFRITVKREDSRDGHPPGGVSTFLHQSVVPGTVLTADKPVGDFILDAPIKAPLVMLSAGIGITPMVVMLRQAIRDCLANDEDQPIWIFHGSHSSREHVFSDEVRDLAALSENVTLQVCYSRPTDACLQGRDYDVRGRIDVDLINDPHLFDTGEFYVCGPAGFMRDMIQGLRSNGVPERRIHYEAFGADPIRRNIAPTATNVEVPGASLRVRFERSGLDAVWTQADGTLLEFAVSLGIFPISSCRSGWCGACTARILDGSVRHFDDALADHSADRILLCSSVPDSDCVIDL